MVSIQASIQRARDEVDDLKTKLRLKVILFSVLTSSVFSNVLRMQHHEVERLSALVTRLQQEKHDIEMQAATGGRVLSPMTRLPNAYLH